MMHLSHQIYRRGPKYNIIVMKIHLLILLITIVFSKKYHKTFKSRQFDNSITTGFDSMIDSRSELNLEYEKKEKKSEEAGAKVMKDIENLGNYSYDDYEEDRN